MYSSAIYQKEINILMVLLRKAAINYGCLILLISIWMMQSVLLKAPLGALKTDLALSTAPRGVSLNPSPLLRALMPSWSPCLFLDAAGLQSPPCPLTFLSLQHPKDSCRHRCHPSCPCNQNHHAQNTLLLPPNSFATAPYAAPCGIF